MKTVFFKLAKKVSFQSPSRCKVGAVVVNRNNAISVGYNNMSKTHPKAPGKYKFLHAEIKALLGLSYDETRGSDIYVYRETLNGQIAKSKPCPVCHSALQEAGIKNIYYTSEEGFQKQRLF